MNRLPAHIKVVGVLALFLLTLQACAQAAPTLQPTLVPTPTSVPTVLAPLPPQQTQASPPPCTQIGQQWVSPIDKVTLVCVPSGEFTMGADNNDPLALANEKPQHKVQLDAFWIDRTEATNANFQACVNAGACRPRPTQPGSTGVASHAHMTYYYDSETANYPVLIYTVEEAQTYCKWAGRRLPTEAEWEKAARGTDGRRFPWGSEDDCAHGSFLECDGDPTDVTTPLAGASPYGALNMAGNVWEWVSDHYAPDYYAHSPAKNPTGPNNDAGSVIRGGGWHSLTRDLRVTARTGGGLQHYIDGQLGFRCALSAKPS